VKQMQNFAEEDLRDEEGQLYPKENMLIFRLSQGVKVVVRPSGTEPKIKYYLSGYSTQEEEHVVDKRLEALWEAIFADLQQRKEG